MTPHRASAVALAAAAGLCTLTACTASSGKHDAPSPSSAGTSAEVSTTGAGSTADARSAAPTTVDSATADALLHQVVLTAGDFPTGWAAHAVPPTAAGSAGQAALVKCAGGIDTSSHTVKTVNSDSYTQAASTVSSTVSRYASQADVDADAALLRRPKTSACYQALATRALRSSLPAGTTFVSANLRVLPTPSGAPKNVVAVATGTIVVKVSGRAVTLYQTSAFITGRTIEAKVDVQGVDTPVAAQVQEHVIDVVAVRAADV